MSTRSTSSIKAVLFDFMGTCLDWHSTILPALPSSLPADLKSKFALEWRQTYFDANAARIRDGKPTQDIDITHQETLLEMLNKYPDVKHLFTPEVQKTAIETWHKQTAWPEVSEALKKLRKHGWEIFVHANGTTRLQLNLVRSAGLEFDMLFSSELLKTYKPALESYEKALELLKLGPEEVVMVAAHAYDLRGAKAAGIKTVYIRRWTDDILEDQEVIKGETDAYLENMDQLEEVIAGL